MQFVKPFFWVSMVLVLTGCGHKPYQPTDKRLGAETIIAYKLDVESSRRGPSKPDAPRLAKWEVLKEKTVQSDGLKDRIRKQLELESNFGGKASDCFDPGLAFRFVDGDQTTDYVVCLSCGWLYSFDGGVDRSREEANRKPPVNKQLSSGGKKRLMSLYDELFD